jgi:uncharacterized protein (DUF58 family)
MIVSRLKERLSFARRAPAETDPFDPAFLSRLDRLRLRFGRAQGRRAGETPVRGRTQESGIEIESFKSYASGDDIRYVDWNAVGRLDQLLTRRFVAEREIPLHLFLDASASMGTPESDGKFLFAQQVVAALAYIGLNNNDAVRVAALRTTGGEVSVSESPVLRHSGRYLFLKSFFRQLEPSGGTALAEGTRWYLERHSEGGVAFVVSDFLVEEPLVREALERLRARRLDVWAIHVVGRGERDLEGLWGRIRLVDAESGELRDVTLSEADRRRYRADFEERAGRLRELCHRNGIGHVLADTGRGVQHALTSAFPSEGMLRLR